jgi:hypothetical protein
LEEVAIDIAMQTQAACCGLFKAKRYGAPGKIRTPDPQIRSLVLYPAELPVHRLRSAPWALMSVKARTLSPPLKQLQGAIDRLFKARS